jgi:hypothetical protein
MAVKAHSDNLQRATAELPTQLRAIGCDERLSPRDRRGILEALRTEMNAASQEGQAAAAAITVFLDENFGPDLPAEGARPACTGSVAAPQPIAPPRVP